MNHESSVRARSIIATVVAATLIPTAFAQQPEPQGLEEIIVTARRVAENLQDTPIADHRVHRRGAGGPAGLLAPTSSTRSCRTCSSRNNAPLAGNNSSSQVFIRGIGQTDPTSTVDPGVGLYIDDVYIGTAVGGTMSLRDIANVQVLRGPQGTLFGRNTIGGAVLLTTTDPGEEFGGTASAAARLRQSDRRLPRAWTCRSRTCSGRASPPASASRTATSRAPTARTSATPTPTRSQQVRVDSPRNSSRQRSRSTTRTRTRTAARSCSRPSTDGATFPRVASARCRLPRLHGRFASAAAPVPNIPDDRCANDFQARGPYQQQRHAAAHQQLDELGHAR